MGDEPGSPKNTLLKHKLSLRPCEDGSGRQELAPIAGSLTFDKGFYMFIRAVQLLKGSSGAGAGPVLVGIAGPSGAGKTVFCEKVREFLPSCAVLCMDMYNDASRLVDDNFDDPSLTDYSTLLANLEGLRQGREVQVPVYDFKQSRRVGYRPVAPPAGGVVILEGIYALSDRLRPLLDLRVSVTGGVHFDLVKRVLRDIKRSGQAPEEIISQITETVYPMYKAFIEPDLQTAHLRIVNHFNPFQGFQQPTYILKSEAPVSEEHALAVLGPGSTRTRETATHDIYLVPPGETPEECQSWLRMRNRDGHYTLMFEEFVTDGPFIVSPRIKFEVSVKILGGLMALGYKMGAIIKRNSVTLKDDMVSVKLDRIEGIGRNFVQVQGRMREAVDETGRRLGLDGTYTALSYIEIVQKEHLTQAFSFADEEARRRFALNDILPSSGNLQDLLPGPPATPGPEGGAAASQAPRSPPSPGAAASPEESATASEIRALSESQLALGRQLEGLAAALERRMAAPPLPAAGGGWQASVYAGALSMVVAFTAVSTVALLRASGRAQAQGG